MKGIGGRGLPKRVPIGVPVRARLVDYNHVELRGSRVAWHMRRHLRVRRLLTLAPAYLLLLAACAAPSVAPATVTVTPVAPTSAPVSTPAGASSLTAAPKQSSASTKPAVGLLRIAIPNDEGTLTPYTYKFG